MLIFVQTVKAKKKKEYDHVFDFSTIFVHVNGSYSVFVKHGNKFYTNFRSVERLTTLLDERTLEIDIS